MSCIYIYIVAAIRLGGGIHPSQLCARADDAPSISYSGGGKGFPTGGQVIPSSSLYIHPPTHTHTYTNHSEYFRFARTQTLSHTQYTTYYIHYYIYTCIKLQFVGDGRVYYCRHEKGAYIPPFAQNLNCACACVCDHR